jgi:plasmid stabilization system protein ParE
MSDSLPRWRIWPITRCWGAQAWYPGPGTRELIPHESYRLVYEVEGDTVWILALVHTARMWPQR